MFINLLTPLAEVCPRKSGYDILKHYSLIEDLEDNHIKIAEKKLFDILRKIKKLYTNNWLRYISDTINVAVSQVNR